MTEYERLSLALLGQIASGIQNMASMMIPMSEEAKEAHKEILLHQARTLSGFLEEVNKAVRR